MVSKILYFPHADMLVVFHFQAFCLSPLLLLPFPLTKISVGNEKIECILTGRTGTCPLGSTHKVGVLDFNCIEVQQEFFLKLKMK